MIRCVRACLLLGLLLGIAHPVSARPDYLARFEADAFRRAEVGGCVTCHVNAAGGGARNDFGIAYEAASREITPLLRANFPQNFRFDSVTLPDGSMFSFSDPQSRFVVIERQKQKVVADISALGAPAAALPKAANRMTFFVTSAPVPHGARMGGLAGADRHCQNLAKAVGADDRTWRAYLSTSFGDKPAVNAGDRIGNGPWYNARGVLIARGAADLHAKERLRDDALLTEESEVVSSSADHSASPAILTGSLPNGTAAVGKTCSNWTSAAAGETMAGDLSLSWNSARAVRCGETVQARLYCFAGK